MFALRVIRASEVPFRVGSYCDEDGTANDAPDGFVRAFLRFCVCAALPKHLVGATCRIAYLVGLLGYVGDVVLRTVDVVGVRARM